MSLTSEELNYLIWRYLQETGNELTALAIQEETRVLEFDDKYKQHVPMGTLVNLVQKGILFCESELLVEATQNGNIDEIKDIKFQENFNLVNALKIDKDKFPEIASEGRFALAHDDIEQARETKGNGSKNEDVNMNSIGKAKNTTSTLPLNNSGNGKIIESNKKSVPYANDINKSDSSLGEIAKLQMTEIYKMGTAITSSWNPMDSTVLAVGYEDSVAKIIKFSDSQEKQSMFETAIELRHPFALSYSTGKTTNQITNLEWSPDGECLITGVENGEIRLWNKQGLLKNVFNFHRSSIITMKWNYNSTLFLSLDIENIAILWNASTGTVLQHFELLNSNNSSIDYNSSGRTKSNESSNDDINSNKNKNTGDDSRDINKTHSNVIGVDIEWVDKDKFVLPGQAGCLNVYDINERRPIGKLLGHETTISCIKFNHETRLLATSSDDYSVRVWHGSSSNATHCFFGHSQCIISLDWISNDLIITASLDGSIRVWSLSQRKMVSMTLYDGLPILVASLSHDREIYAVGYLNGEIKMYDVSGVKSSTDFKEPPVLPMIGEYNDRDGKNCNVDSEIKEDNVLGLSWDHIDSKLSITYSNSSGIVMATKREII